MTTTKRVSIIMVDGSFRESFHAVDYFAQQAFPADDYELIWVEYYDRVHPDLAAKLAAYPHARSLILGRTGEYHSSYCFNGGLQAATGELILIPDGDLVVEPHFLQTVWEEHQTNDKLVMYIRRYNEPQAEHRDDWTLDHLKRVSRLTNPMNHGACLTVRKKWLLAINGYEQHPIFSTGFHSNDKDIYMRLSTLGLPVMWHPSLRLYHPWHPATSAFAPQYDMQRYLTRYRAMNEQTLAFEGIDPQKNVPMPAEVADYAEKVKQAAWRKHLAKSALKWVLRRR